MSNQPDTQTQPCLRLPDRKGLVVAAAQQLGNLNHP
jgi:hypothetical protein